ncbi:TetR/AcrR family transcriptional regulator [Nocardia paucivorans]|uniref:TetR/AcrR family transcriptional regulator n=1 Tax=Nocardia paucivorans TaxID=114259 RepID=UPI0003132853|nr:TetR/AcrR family transcriptional regulator [Nocardia paucivorans]
MGNKEDLLAAARECIYERGFAATTARDIANKAGVSLAAIGYHFGSKDRLLTEAFTTEAGREIGDALEASIRDTAGQPLAVAFPQVWEGIAELFARNREVMVASVENMVRIYRTGSERARMGELNAHAVSETAAMLRQAHPGLRDDQAHAVAQLYFILVNGLALQWVSNPDGELPSGADLATAIAALAPHTTPDSQAE